MVSTPKAPTPPDPNVTAAAQTGTNLATAQGNAVMNNINQVTPYGNLTYQQTGKNFISDPNGQQYYVDAQGTYHDSLPTKSVASTSGDAGHYVTQRGNHGDSTQVWVPGSSNTSSSNQAYTPDGWSSVKGEYVPSYTATQTLSDAQQKILDQTQAAQLNLGTLANSQSARLNDWLGQSFDPLKDAPAAGIAPNSQDISKDRQRVEDALNTRLNTQLSRDKGSMEQTLADQGIKLGSQAYGSAQQIYGQNVNDARTAAILSAGQAQTQEAGLAQQQFQDANTARQNYLTEQYAARSQPINEISALMSGSQVQQPTYAGFNQSQAPTVDYAGLVNQNYQAQQQNYQTQVASSNAAMGGLFGLAGAGLGGWAKTGFALSDRRLKNEIERIGTLPSGLPIYEYNYVWGGDRQIGVMADEAAEIFPDAVATGPANFLMVDYARIN